VLNAAWKTPVGSWPVIHCLDVHGGIAAGLPVSCVPPVLLVLPIQVVRLDISYQLTSCTAQHGAKGPGKSRKDRRR
jgi:hypothetical protein